MTWTTIATGLTARSYSDSSLGYNTTYYYLVLASSPAGVSLPSAVVSARTLPAPDVLSLSGLVFGTVRHSVYSGPLASFTDWNTSALAGQFYAAVNWGDGSVSSAWVVGGEGQFVVEGRHVYARPGTYAVTIGVVLSSLDQASATGVSTAQVSGPINHRPPHFFHGARRVSRHVRHVFRGRPR